MGHPTDDRNYRLPESPRPRRYAAALSLDLEGRRFDGQGTIEVVLGAPTSEIVLHALELEVQRAVRTREHKLIVYPEAKITQLFDLAKDPWEIHNLAGNPEHAATLAMLDAKLRELMRELKDPLPPEKVFATSPTSGVNPTRKGP